MFIQSGHSHHLVAFLSLPNASLRQGSESVLSELKKKITKGEKEVSQRGIKDLSRAKNVSVVAQKMKQTFHG